MSYDKLRDRTWDNEILSYVAKIHEYKGKHPFNDGNGRMSRLMTL